MLPFVVYSRCVGWDLETYEVFSPELRREACASALRMLVTNNADNQAMIPKKQGIDEQYLALSGMVQCQVAVAHAGAIHPLVQLLQDEAPLGL